MCAFYHKTTGCMVFICILLLLLLFLTSRPIAIAFDFESSFSLLCTLFFDWCQVLFEVVCLLYFEWVDSWHLFTFLHKVLLNIQTFLHARTWSRTFYFVYFLLQSLGVCYAIARIITISYRNQSPGPVEFGVSQ